ncbi:MAG: DEAD/DEAH box helicase [Gammaproteobacteria bacterium]|nr:DEAD/DEAH box helicase [Gammaproteobacteria bacterium]
METDTPSPQLFSTLLLDEPLLEALETLELVEMTEVQQVAIAQALAGKDLIVNAKTGSGKTLAFVLPLLQQILDNPQSVAQAIILAPTRELCRQINKQCTLLAQYTKIKTAVIIGGEDPKYQIKVLEQYPEIIVATPGRLLEHVKRGMVDLDAINILVLDEADRMLAMGFNDDVIKIARQCNEECQTVLYSASFNESKFQDLTDKVLYEAERILIDSTREGNENVTQQKILADDHDHKIKLCVHILQNEDENLNFHKAIVFANKKETVNSISGWLQSKNIPSATVHSDIDQDKRNMLLRKFRNDDLNVMIATDVASRGLDIKDLDLIINFDVPQNGEDYMHRIGRTGRMHETGLALTLVNAQEWNKMISIENFLQIECTERKIKSLVAKYTGPENRKSSGKAYGKKKDTKQKNKNKKKEINKIKVRARDKKNVGKRRAPTEKKISIPDS